MVRMSIFELEHYRALTPPLYGELGEIMRAYAEPVPLINNGFHFKHDLSAAQQQKPAAGEWLDLFDPKPPEVGVDGQ